MEHESVAALRKCVFAVSVFGDDHEVIANLTHDLTATDWVAAIHLLWRSWDILAVHADCTPEEVREWITEGINDAADDYGE